MNQIIGISAILLLLCSCGNERSIVFQEEDQCDTLFLSDGVGVLMGDSNYVFGEVGDISCIPGGIVLSDNIRGRISVFDSTGRFLFSGGGRGDGPGEFLQPIICCRLATGDFFVFDFGDRTASVISDSLVYKTSYSMHWGIPIYAVAAADSSIVLKQLVVEFADEVLKAGYRVMSMNAYTGEEETVYREYMAEMGASEVDLRPWYCFFTADLNGNVYLADYDSDSYSIDVLAASGDSLYTIEMEAEQRPDFNRETHQLMYLPINMPLTTSEGTSTLRITHPEKHPYVTFMYTDGDENLWVRRMGLADSEYWDVISPDGVLLRKVILYSDTIGTASYPSLHVSPWGMVATGNEYEVERFYIVDSD